MGVGKALASGLEISKVPLGGVALNGFVEVGGDVLIEQYAVNESLAQLKAEKLAEQAMLDRGELLIRSLYNGGLIAEADLDATAVRLNNSVGYEKYGQNQYREWLEQGYPSRQEFKGSSEDREKMASFFGNLQEHMLGEFIDAYQGNLSDRLRSTF